MEDAPWSASQTQKATALGSGRAKMLQNWERGVKRAAGEAGLYGIA
jgi:DNA-binding transcriptional regulator YiaG